MDLKDTTLARFQFFSEVKRGRKFEGEVQKEIAKITFGKTFNNVHEDLQQERQNCTGQKCKDCLLCYKLDTTDTIVEKVKSYGKK